ncbi:MAG: hypothetical protein HYZ12_06395 [Thaumarchaeota archaeon]|nr:hypothetical protein [Nitrososphaerota archaeon]
MDIGGCCFPDALLYDAEGLTWVRIEQGRLTLGLTQFNVFKIGKIVSTRIKGEGTALQKLSPAGKPFASKGFLLYEGHVGV